MMPIVSTLDRGEFTVKLRAFSSQREDYEEFPIKVDVCVEIITNRRVTVYMCIHTVVIN